MIYFSKRIFVSRFFHDSETINKTSKRKRSRWKMYYIDRNTQRCNDQKRNR